MKVLIIDNYDSFTYNLYQFIGEILESKKSSGEIENFDIDIKRNDKITIDEIVSFKPDRIFISPGPGSPDNEEYFGICSDVIINLGKTIPILGVCLGMQGIVYNFGGNIILADSPMHGKTSPINHNNEGLFKNIPNNLEVMRYHSLMAKRDTFPECLKITATVGNISSNDFVIMGIQHKKYPIYGIQFHPESFATEGGKDIISNFLFGESK